MNFIESDVVLSHLLKDNPFRDSSAGYVPTPPNVYIPWLAELAGAGVDMLDLASRNSEVMGCYIDPQPILGESGFYIYRNGQLVPEASLMREQMWNHQLFNALAKDPDLAPELDYVVEDWREAEDLAPLWWETGDGEVGAHLSIMRKVWEGGMKSIAGKALVSFGEYYCHDNMIYTCDPEEDEVGMCLIPLHAGWEYQRSVSEIISSGLAISREDNQIHREGRSSYIFGASVQSGDVRAWYFDPRQVREVSGDRELRRQFYDLRELENDLDGAIMGLVTDKFIDDYAMLQTLAFELSEKLEVRRQYQNDLRRLVCASWPASFVNAALLRGIISI